MPKTPIMKTKIEESLIKKKQVFVTLPHTEELLALITKRIPLINFQSYFNFAVQTDCT